MIGQECDPNDILLDPLTVMKREMSGGLTIEQDKAASVAFIPKVGGA